jgi:hypothetical protein
VYPVSKFPLYDNVTQFLNLLWDDSSETQSDACVHHDQVISEGTGRTQRVHLGFSTLCSSLLASTSIDDTIGIWNQWKNKVKNLCELWELEKKRKLEEKQRIEAEKLAIRSREVLKIQRLRAREAALKLQWAVERFAQQLQISAASNSEQESGIESEANDLPKLAIKSSKKSNSRKSKRYGYLTQGTSSTSRKSGNGSKKKINFESEENMLALTQVPLGVWKQLAQAVAFSINGSGPSSPQKIEHRARRSNPSRSAKKSH